MVPVLIVTAVLAVAVIVLCALLYNLSYRVTEELRASQGLRDKLVDALATLTTRGKSLEERLKDVVEENTALVKTVASLAPQTQHREYLEEQVKSLQSVVIGTLKENADLAQTRIMSLLDIRASALAGGQVRMRQEDAGYIARPIDGFTREPPETAPTSTVDEAPREPRRRSGENKVRVPLSPALTDAPYEPEEELVGTGFAEPGQP